MLLTLGWPALPIARIGCCRPPQPNRTKNPSQSQQVAGVSLLWVKIHPAKSIHYDVGSNRFALLRGAHYAPSKAATWLLVLNSEQQLLLSHLRQLETSNEISNGSKELGVLLSHEPMAALLEHLLLGVRYPFDDLIRGERRRDLVVAPGENEGR